MFIVHPAHSLIEHAEKSVRELPSDKAVPVRSRYLRHGPPPEACRFKFPKLREAIHRPIEVHGLTGSRLEVLQGVLESNKAQARSFPAFVSRRYFCDNPPKRFQLWIREFWRGRASNRSAVRVACSWRSFSSYYGHENALEPAQDGCRYRGGWSGILAAVCIIIRTLLLMMAISG